MQLGACFLLNRLRVGLKRLDLVGEQLVFLLQFVDVRIDLLQLYLFLLIHDHPVGAENSVIGHQGRESENSNRGNLATRVVHALDGSRAHDSSALNGGWEVNGDMWALVVD